MEKSATFACDWKMPGKTKPKAKIHAKQLLIHIHVYDLGLRLSYR